MTKTTKTAKAAVTVPTSAFGEALATAIATTATATANATPTPTAPSAPSAPVMEHVGPVAAPKAATSAGRPYFSASMAELAIAAATDPAGVKAEVGFRITKRATAGKPIFPTMRSLADSLGVGHIGTDWKHPAARVAKATPEPAKAITPATEAMAYLKPGTPSTEAPKVSGANVLKAMKAHGLTASQVVDLINKVVHGQQQQ